MGGEAGGKPGVRVMVGGGNSHARASSRGYLMGGSAWREPEDGM